MVDMKKISSPEYNLQEKIRRNIYALITGAKEIIKPGTITTQYPREKRRMPDNFRGYIIFDMKNCVNCFQCSFVCPANAIYMKEAPDMKYYPIIDYAKCIFCHFCVDSCLGGALKPTKIHDVAYKDLDEMITLTEEMIEPPDVLREDSFSVDYVIKNGDLFLEKKGERDSLLVEVAPPKKIPMVCQCVDPESCLGDASCANICESGAISFFKDEEQLIVRVKIDVEKCTGCGLCVKECPMQVLKLVRR